MSYVLLECGEHVVSVHETERGEIDVDIARINKRPTRGLTFRRTEAGELVDEGQYFLP